VTGFERGFRAGLLEGMEVEQERILGNLQKQLDKEIDPMFRIMLKQVIKTVKGDKE